MKVAFLDRDGVINTEVNYLHRINDFEYTYKCKDALLQLIKKGFKLIIVTNQAGIAKAIFTEEEYYKLTDFYKEDLFKDNILIHDIFYCPHHVDGILKNFSIECNCRKPNSRNYKKVEQRRSYSACFKRIGSQTISTH